MTKLGKFEIQEQLGQGGMGVVYRAWDSRMERWVALKTIHPDKNTRTQFLKRFRQEALSAGRLDHRNIVTIYEFDEQDDVCYIAMQFLEGTDLETLMVSPTWDQDFNVFRKLDVLVQIAHGLAYAHRNGVVHRDVKPANIMILGDGTAKIVDFGIARIGEATSQSHTMLGTAPYMAPEQIEGKLVDERVDVFALGVIGYRMFTRHFPFEADNLSSILYKIVHEDPPSLSLFSSDHPQELETVLMTALAKDRNKRYRTMEEFGFELQTLLSSLNTMLVSSYVDESRRLLLVQDYQRAKELLRKVLELEPSNANALQLWQQVQKLQQQEYAKRKVQELLNGGIEAYQEGDWDRALECFDQGLQLDPQHEMLRTYCELTVREQEKNRAISDKLKAARDARQRNDLQGARALLHELAEMSPGHAEGQALLSEVEAAIKEIERRRQAEQLMAKAQEAISSREWSEAVRLLDEALRLDPENRHVARLRMHAATEQAEADKQRRRAEKIGAVQAMIERGEFRDAVNEAQAGLVEFSNDPALQQLLNRASQGVESQRRKRQFTEFFEQANGRLAQNDVTGARQLLVLMQQLDGSDARIEQLRQSIAQAEDRILQDRHREEEMQRARQLVRGAEYEQAEEVLRAAREKFGASAAMQELLQSVRQEARRARQERESCEAIAKARELFLAGSFEQGAELLRKQSRKRKDAAVAAELQAANRLIKEKTQYSAHFDAVFTAMEQKEWEKARNLLVATPDAWRRHVRYRDLCEVAAENGYPVETPGAPGAPGAPPPQPDALQKTFVSPPALQQTVVRQPDAEPPSGGAPVQPAREPEVAPAGREPEKRAAAAPPAMPAPEPHRAPARPEPATFFARLPAVIQPPRFWYAAATLAVVLVIGIVLMMRPGGHQAPGGGPGAAAAPAGTIEIDASPWATIKEVRSRAGEKIDVPQAQTPVLLSLPAGEYRVVLSNPKFGEATVAVHIDATAAAAPVRHVFPQFDVEDVLKGYE